MSHKINIELTEAQFKAANTHAEKKGRKLAEDLVLVWWGRMSALSTYAEKITQKGQKFRPYTPRLLEDKMRDELKAQAVKAGIGVKPAAPYVPKPRKVKAAKKAAPKAAKKTPAARKNALGGPASVKADAALKKVAEPKAPPKAVPPVKKVKVPKEKPAKGIDLYDSDAVALAKARLIHEKGGRSVAEILKDNARDETGKLLPKTP